MTEHEPECWCRGCTHPHVCGRCRNCICDELRACEQRVLATAREAIRIADRIRCADDALAAIDALKEKP